MDGVIESKWTEVAGAKVHYLEAGPAEGQAVVLLHGASFQAETWHQIGTLSRLSKNGFRALAIDLPGYGKSPATEVDPGNWLSDLLNELGVHSPVVVSPSMSGRFSLPLVTNSPERVAGFVAVAPVAIQAHRQKLGSITAPVLAVWGEHDRIVPHDLADTLVNSVPRGRKVVIQGAGHAPYMNDADAFHEALLSFLGEAAG